MQLKFRERIWKFMLHLSIAVEKIDPIYDDEETTTKKSLS